jgi:hypothetical protein
LPYIRPAGYSTLVVVLLWEGKSGAAWQAATAGDCWDEPWLRAARERAATHPADAIPTLLAAADQAIGHKNRDSYQVATRLLMEAFAIPALATVRRTSNLSCTLHAAHKPKRGTDF